MELIGGWTVSYLARWLRDWLRRNPLPAQDQLTIKNLTITGKLTTPDLVKKGDTSYSDSGATVVHSAGKFTGGIGSTSYTIGDVVQAMKLAGMLPK